MPEWMHLAFSRLMALFTGGKLDAEFQTELDEHLRLLTEEYRVQGFSPEDARRKALIKLGGATATRELHRETRGWPGLEALSQDVHYAFRTFRREPGYFAIAVLIIGLGIGAASSIFSVVNTLVLKPLPFADAERLVFIANDGTNGLSGSTLRTGELASWRDATESFEELGGYFAFFEYTSMNLVGEGQAERIRAAAITDGFLSALGVNPHLGRDFVSEETVFNGRPAVLLSDRYWRLRFNADPNVIGKSLEMNGGVLAAVEPFTVVGVLPPSFDFAAVFRPGMDFDVFTVFPVSPETDDYGNTLEVVGRLKPGVTAAAAQDELNRVNGQLRREQPERGNIVGVLSPLQDHVNGRFKPALLMLSGAVGLLLLIACINLSNLLLARASSRRKEIALRSALGAGRMRIVRQMLTESIVLAVCGSAVGIAFALGLTQFVSSLSILNIPLLGSVTVDGPVLAFSVGAALLCGVLFGMAPALQVASSREASALKESGRGMSESKDRAWLRGALVVAETALACVLLVGAGLLMRSFWTLMDVDPGFRPEQTASWKIDPKQQDAAERFAYIQRLISAVEAVPGVVSVGTTDALPFDASRSWFVGAKGVIYGQGEVPGAFPRLVSEGYLSTLGIPLIAGRGITRQDDQDHEKVAVINETMAASLWPGQDALGQTLIANGNVERTVVGVVRDVKHSSLEEESGMEMYFPLLQTNWTMQVQLAVRTSLPMESLVPAVRQALAAEDPLLPTGTFQSLADKLDRSLSPRKFTLWLIGAFSLAALILASLGIYGVVSYSVNQRIQEIGIRMTLGASAGSVRAQVVRSTLLLASVGIAIGLVASLLLAGTMSSLLFGVSAADPWTFGGMTVVLVVVAALAGFIPAYRISRTDLASVLRSA